MAPRKLPWTLAQRTTVHLLHTTFGYALEDQVHIFNLVYATELNNAGYTKGLTQHHYRDEYKHRFKAGKSGMWSKACGSPSDEETQKLHDSLPDTIKSAAEALGLEPASPKKDKEDNAMFGEDQAAGTKTSSELETMPLTTKKRKPEAGEISITPKHKNPSTHGACKVNEDYVALHPEQMFQKLPAHSNRFVLQEAHPAVPMTRKRAKTAKENNGQLQTVSAVINKVNADAANTSDHVLPAQTNQERQTGKAHEGDTPADPATNMAAAPHTVEYINAQHSYLKPRMSNEYTAGTTQPPDSMWPRTPYPFPAEKMIEGEAWDAENMRVILPQDPPATLSLEMIHHSFEGTTWDANSTPHSSAKAFIAHDDEIFLLGGKVYRAKIDREWLDVMICKSNQCTKCSPSEAVVKAAHGTESPTGGLPFVHASDCYCQTRGAGLLFAPKIKEYSPEYPVRMWKTKVSFKDGDYLRMPEAGKFREV
ncbi:hypothetical protein LTR37_014461 [Vermiconidia calcicola]|uniref:Uncharacterized protein n=1 Tax=Vermiconidia calcicola TaxID=1690605 RepID=A0ACC3MTL8_9PEZI|nr:hypothetical protein LTR37_014461 [Vermiconidia calcicola]